MIPSSQSREVGSGAYRFWYDYNPIGKMNKIRDTESGTVLADWDYGDTSVGAGGYAADDWNPDPGAAVAIGYDQSGNMISRGADSLVWDAVNRLHSYDAATGTDTSLVYDADGNPLSRPWKEISHKGVVCVPDRTYVRYMEWERLTEDQLDQVIVGAESGISRLRSVEMAAITEKRRRGTHPADGYRSILDWVAARADVSHQTARRLTWTASRLGEAHEVHQALADGDISFDRAEQVARLPEGFREGHERFDIGQLGREVALHRRLSPKREREITNSGFVQFQTSLDQTVTRFWGQLPGVDARVVEKAIDQRADEIIPPEDKLAVAERRALALVAISQDSLYETLGEGATPSTRVTVTVDARTATKTNGQTGVAVLEGSRIGSQALEAVICDATVEVIGITEAGESLNLGRKTRTISPALRRQVISRDHACAVDGCTSRYRLQVHHRIPWSQGGRTDVDNLVTLCWYHHQVAVHRHGMRIDRIAPSRVRLVKPTQQRAPPSQRVAA